MKPEKVETVCQHCVFAKCDVHRVQYDCVANMLDVYEKQGIYPFKKYGRPEGGQFFGIPGRVCPYLRYDSWLQQQPEGEDLLLIARDEMTLRMEVIIYISPEDDFTTIGKTIDSLAEGRIRPTKLVFCDHKNIRPSTFRNWINGRTSMAWRAEHIRGQHDFHRAIHLTANKIDPRDSFLFAVFRAGFSVPPTFISNLDIALHDNFERFLILRPFDELFNGFVIHTHYKGLLLPAKNDKTYLDQAEEFLCANPHLIKSVTQFVTSTTCESPQSASQSLFTTTKSGSEKHSKA